MPYLNIQIFMNLGHLISAQQTFSSPLDLLGEVTTVQAFPGFGECEELKRRCMETIGCKKVSTRANFHQTMTDTDNLVLRVQFLDAKTTLDRWKEEEELVKVEMIRTADYFRWMMDVWNQRTVYAQDGPRAHASSMRLIYANLEHKIRSKITEEK
jgi:hypothetical protein